MKEIQQQFIDYNRSARSMKPSYIVVHDTGDAGATDQNEHDYFAGGDRQASADFFVDKDSITQIIDTDNYYSWHCGDGGGKYGISNRNSLGIEMCLESDGTVSDATIQNTLDLIKFLMSKYDIHIDRVARHYDASRKCCPNSFSSNNWAKWYWFKGQIDSGSSSGEWKLSTRTNKWWYDLGDGDYVQDSWKKIDGKWYLFDIDGWMITGWKLDENKWYYLNPVSDGSQGEMKTGWIFDKNYGKWYYCNSDGDMLTGWQNLNDAWYYLNSDGSMATGWIKNKGKDYMLYSNGEMVCNCDYVGYHFDADGVATKL